MSRSIGRVRATPLAALTCAATRARSGAASGDRRRPQPPGRTRPRPRGRNGLAARTATAARAAKTLTVTAALQGLLKSGAITEATYAQDYATYVAAKRSLGRLSGTRAAELGAVLANVQQIAAAGALSGSLQASVFLTLEENRHWWTTEPLLSADERVKSPPSELVWEYYPGQGLEIQWLATFGEGNGYFLSGHENNNLRTLLGEILPLATHVGSRHRVGVPVPFRRRRPAVDQRALTGHRACSCSRAATSA